MHLIRVIKHAIRSVWYIFNNPSHALRNILLISHIKVRQRSKIKNCVNYRCYEYHKPLFNIIISATSLQANYNI